MPYFSFSALFNYGAINYAGLIWQIHSRIHSHDGEKLDAMAENKFSVYLDCIITIMLFCILRNTLFVVKYRYLVLIRITVCARRVEPNYHRRHNSRCVSALSKLLSYRDSYCLLWESTLVLIANNCIERGDSLSKLRHWYTHHPQWIVNCRMHILRRFLTFTICLPTYPPLSLHNVFKLSSISETWRFCRTPPFQNAYPRVHRFHGFAKKWHVYNLHDPVPDSSIKIYRVKINPSWFCKMPKTILTSPL